MEIAIIGLGKMGLGISKRLTKEGHKVYGYDSNWNASEYSKNNINGSISLIELIDKFQDSKKIVWVMVPSGDPTKTTISKLKSLLSSGDVVIDGGNSFYKDSINSWKNYEKYLPSLFNNLSN